MAQVEVSGTVALKSPLTSDLNEASVPETMLADGETSVKLRLTERAKASITLGAMTLDVNVTVSPGTKLEAVNPNALPDPKIASENVPLRKLVAMAADFCKIHQSRRLGGKPSEGQDFAPSETPRASHRPRCRDGPAPRED
jgi:hypothetical protein